MSPQPPKKKRTWNIRDQLSGPRLTESFQSHACAWHMFFPPSYHCPFGTGRFFIRFWVYIPYTPIYTTNQTNHWSNFYMHIYIYQYVICQYIPRYKYMLLKSNHESCDMVWLLCLFWGFACIGWHFQTIVCSIRTSPTSEWTPKRYESLPSENLRWVCWRFEIHILDFRGMSSQLCCIAGTTRR